MLTRALRKFLLMALCTTCLNVSAQILPSYDTFDRQQLVGHYAIHLDKSTETHMSEQAFFHCTRITPALIKRFKQCRLDGPDVYYCNLTIRPAALVSSDSDPDFVVLKTLKACESFLDAMIH